MFLPKPLPFYSGLILGLLLLILASSVSARGSLPDFVPLVEQNSAAVVNISTTRKVSSAQHPRIQIPEQLPEDMFGDLLRRFFGEGGAAPHAFDTTSLGSGFIISADGYVVTNHHVVQDADEILVRLSDRRTFTATLIGSDPRSDIALLKVEAEGLPTLKLGDSSDLKVGEWVLAIGSPFGFDHSVTAGIVSAKGRSLPRENYVPFIQTDVAINPGNSGGPLFNMQGEVIGINSQIYSRTGGFMGLSFAIPVEMAMDVVAQLKDKGYVSRGWLGVLIQEVTRDLADSFGMPRPAGALVAQVFADSPAQHAGIRVGDVILAFNDQDVPRSNALPPIVGRTPVGETANVRILRDGKELTLKVAIGELPADDEIASQTGTPTPADTPKSTLGMQLEAIPDDMRQELNLAQGGLIVRQVDGEPARSAGIRSGDLLLMINNRNVDSVAALEELIASLPKGRPVPILLQRGGNPVFIALRIPE